MFSVLIRSCNSAALSGNIILSDSGADDVSVVCSILDC